MKKIYDISAGQLGTIWVFALIGWFWAIGQSDNYFDPSPFAGLLAWLIPLVVIFYSIGWHNDRKQKSS